MTTPPIQPPRGTDPFGVARNHLIALYRPFFDGVDLSDPETVIELREMSGVARCRADAEALRTVARTAPNAMARLIETDVRSFGGNPAAAMAWLENYSAMLATHEDRPILPIGGSHGGGPPTASTFPDQDTAENVVAAVTGAFEADILAWLTNPAAPMAKYWDLAFDDPVGRGLTAADARADRGPGDWSAARVVLRQSCQEIGRPGPEDDFHVKTSA